MGTCVNQRKKFFAEERPKLKRNKPHDPIQLKTYMMNDLKNQGSIELKSAEELSLKNSLKRFGEELQTKTPKRLKEDKDDKAKDDEPTKKLTKRRKQTARKGMHTSMDENVSDDSDKVDEQEETNTGTETPLNPVPVAMKTPSVATYKIIKQGEKGVYQIVREDGTDIVYINFGAMLKSISRDDLIELYRIVMNRYGLDGPEDKLEKGFWKCLRIMFEEPLSTDSIWSEIEQQKIVSWRYYDTSRVHCLNLESMDVYLLSDRKYPLPAEDRGEPVKDALLNFGKIPIEVEGFEPPQEEEILIRRSERTRRTSNRLCLNVEAEEHSLGDLNEPTSYKVTMLDSESNKWIDAMNAEIQSMIENMVWVLVDLPPGYKTVGREAAFILGIKIYRDRSKRLIRLGQNAYMDKILKRYRMDNSKRSHIPMQERFDLNKTQGASTPEEVKRMQIIPYASAVCSIMYDVRCTRPDVAIAQNITSRFQQNPGECHWTAVKNILKYLRNTKDMFLVYGGNPEAELRVDCYCDAGFETDRDDTKSQTRYVFILNGGAVE
ncbi:hypothetical protein Tco_0532843 [Tanacetum coccineum]